MEKIYKPLTPQEHAVVMTMRADLCFIRSIAFCLPVSSHDMHDDALGTLRP
ncbi:hypothetical protein [Janthinobacterium sp. HLX7-2]|uniref:hypothetical protein n=1 Tax=Janthinobacterium sp. HLX7-2 TaxID=1259331 RepID=UPI003F27D8B7